MQAKTEPKFPLSFFWREKSAKVDAFAEKRSLVSDKNEQQGKEAITDGRRGPKVLPLPCSQYCNK
jgi:hypothetical protein